MTLINIYSIGNDSFLKSCIDSLLLSDYKDFKIDLFIVGYENSIEVEKLSKNDLFIDITKLHKIKPYAWVVNKSLHKTMNGDYDNVILLNSDTKVHSQCIELLVRLIQSNNNFGIIGGFQTVYDKGWIKPNEWMEKMLKSNNLNSSILFENKYYNLLHSSYVQGACMIISINLIRQIGFFKEEFGLFYEETEYCRRAYQSGFEIATLKEAKVQHYGGGSWKKNSYKRLKRDIYYLSNQIIFESTQKDNLSNGLLKSILSILKKQIFSILKKNDDISINIILYPIVLLRLVFKLKFLFTLKKNNSNIYEWGKKH